MAEDSDLERTEPASARKLDQAREQGNVPRSRELATLAVLLASVGVIAVIGLFMFRGLSRVMQDTLSFDAGDVASPAMMGRNLMDAGMDGMLLFLPMAVAVVVAAVAANVLISGWVFSTKAFEFDFAKLNPITGLGRLFSWNSLAELVKALMKGGLIAGVAGWMIWHQREGILGLAVEPLDAAMAHFGQITLLTFLAAAAAFGVIVLLDVPFQIWQYHRGLRMTKQEIRQESKEMEGDPQIKARIRSLQREAARRRMMQAVPKADVVVTNPMHFAVALKYEEKTMAAPLVVAKGSQLVAERIKELARENRVPIVEAPPLARALHRHGEVGDVIPAALFTAVAQVLAYVYQLNRSMNPVLPETWDVPPKLDPAARTGAT
ncbi:MAG: flagellar type III secretion system protein FlhB [Thiobacillaceae bacterium]|jgi:flagellar biosynthesis protein FlhB|nr:flagellar type III secretion system protein FlhB [Hydrogenophilales bacterium]MBP8902014.1 flagellar type III secretion system protein FlhB [Thiobacillaceae bacterium]MBP9914753.1 flagellar type III secretion system protein FlhB [Thiobacillaceae bacterium]